jgi:hypothetical protein
MMTPHVLRTVALLALLIACNACTSMNTAEFQDGQTLGKGNQGVSFSAGLGVDFSKDYQALYDTWTLQSNTLASPLRNPASVFNTGTASAAPIYQFQYRLGVSNNDDAFIAFWNSDLFLRTLAPERTGYDGGFKVGWKHLLSPRENQTLWTLTVTASIYRAETNPTLIAFGQRNTDELQFRLAASSLGAGLAYTYRFPSSTDGETYQDTETPRLMGDNDGGEFFFKKIIPSLRTAFAGVMTNYIYTNANFRVKQFDNTFQSQLGITGQNLVVSPYAGISFDTAVPLHVSVSATLYRDPLFNELRIAPSLNFSIGY